MWGVRSSSRRRRRGSAVELRRFEGSIRRDDGRSEPAITGSDAAVVADRVPHRRTASHFNLHNMPFRAIPTRLGSSYTWGMHGLPRLAEDGPTGMLCMSDR